ncbi:MAG TPA: M20/M25/M40 family metallo-hydrolase [Acidobacteriota bacterium]|nr:M20/M25/M40 family metallo-hydrolase [Acidobacteriota bacterium]
MSSSDSLKWIDSYITDSRASFEDMLGQLVEVPTVSMDPMRKPDIQRGASLAAEYLRGFGAEVEIHPTSGNPVVVGRFRVPGARRTVSIYNHIDVQPAQEPEWTRDPFQFSKEDGRYFGRGSTDDKGPALTALFAARYAVQSKTPINIQFIWELEEEIGSPHFEEFLKKAAPALKTDSVLVSDTIWISREKPAMPYGLRGMFTAWMTLETGTNDAHSGVTGGAARNPVGELAQVASLCYDARTGRVKIPGFYDDVKAVSKKEMESFLASGYNLKKWKEVYGFKKLRVNTAPEVLKRVWCMPTFETHGLVGGYSGPGVKTVVPPRAELKFSCRLVPNQDPMKTFKLVQKFVKKVNPDVQVHLEATLDPYLGSFEGPYADAACDALQYGFGKSPSMIREGGSIGAVVTMRKHLKAPITFIGLSLPEHGYHAPNENYDWGQASGGMKTFVKYLANIAEM